MATVFPEGSGPPDMQRPINRGHDPFLTNMHRVSLTTSKLCWECNGVPKCILCNIHQDIPGRLLHPYLRSTIICLLRERFSRPPLLISLAIATTSIDNITTNPQAKHPTSPDS
mmetsp:Transcript_5187/g.10905  ORF Transcript_5187/g.10905 Transcript_5187/m.10905 type:complete len:113 (-) Transcript_5187:122-460(-)